ncbi:MULTISPECIES: DUF2142 domain-containing protein [unclassified Leucobacter]|uniref:DUF2142 domain-containing protein n=1 Tax=unclassified Leucobacter TaxID=2621730 RepID=UPI00165E770C|nr:MULTISPECIES: DUF2142 domain-containing protein [unclassified Leucobacter]MBC9936612.1 DUF2142 domain-containing protein [Leucobacter sp. cx-87]
MKSLLIAAGAGLLIFLTLGAWSLASPVGSAPDDDFHLASIWCGSGAREGICELGTSESKRLAPDKAITSPCYAHDPDVTPSCQGEHFLDSGYDLVETTRVNSGNQYPSGYYFWTSKLASENVATSTIAIRLANSALFAILMVATWYILPRRLRFSLAASVALTFVPVGVFMVASVNPSSWAIASAAFVLPALLGYFSTTGWRQISLAGIAVFAAILSFSARGDSAAYTLVAALAATVLAFRPDRRFWKLSLLPVALIASAIAAFLSTGQTGLALDGAMGETTDEAPKSKATLVILNLLSLPNLWNGVFGQNWGLGWLNTTMPAVVPATIIFLFAGTIFVHMRTIDWRRIVALSGIGLAAIVIPTYILVQSETLVGSHVQPRYILPLITMFLCAVIAPTAATRTATNSVVALSRLQLWLIGFGLAGAHAISLFVNLRRYVTTGSYNLDGDIDWWWNAGPSPFTVLAIGAVAFAALMALFSITSERSDSAPRTHRVFAIAREDTRERDLGAA